MPLTIVCSPTSHHHLCLERFKYTEAICKTSRGQCWYVEVFLRSTSRSKKIIVLNQNRKATAHRTFYTSRAKCEKGRFDLPDASKFSVSMYAATKFRCEPTRPAGAAALGNNRWTSLRGRQRGQLGSPAEVMHAQICPKPHSAFRHFAVRQFSEIFATISRVNHPKLCLASERVLVQSPARRKERSGSAKVESGRRFRVRAAKCAAGLRLVPECAAARSAPS